MRAFVILTEVAGETKPPEAGCRLNIGGKSLEDRETLWRKR
jgi:hypothetical protein